MTIKLSMNGIKIGQKMFASPTEFQLTLNCEKKKHVIINETVKFDEGQLIIGLKSYFIFSSFVKKSKFPN